MIRQQGSENVAAFIAEPIVGASLGAVPPVDEYFGIIREICDKYDVLFIADEVMTGLGRTGQMFGMDLWKVKPDMMSLAKGLSAGYLPLGAVAVREEILELLKKKKSNIASGHTFSAHHITAAVGIAAVQYLLKNDLVSKSRENGAYLLKKLEKLLKHPIVGDVRGRGLFAGIELVKNRKTKQPFSAEEQVAARVGAEALKRGLITYPGTGSVDGVSGDHILLAPPLIITKPQIDEMLSIFDESIGEVEKKVR
jgi:adenosylmethionine-8-amino-7-oxononanoate aminotransferase